MSDTKETKNEYLVDRQKVCPFLLRIFLSNGRHFPLSEYTNRRIPPKTSELQIYTWLDATLQELTGLMREMEEYRTKGTQFIFSIVYAEPSAPSYKMRPIGMTVGGNRTSDDERTLSECRYQIGDFIDVAILPPGVDPSRVNAQIENYNRRNRQRNRGGGDRGPPGRFR